jgi:lysozyme
MKPRHQVSRAAVEFIKRFEGYRPKAASCPTGAGRSAMATPYRAPGRAVSEQDAEALLLYDLISISHAVNEPSTRR